MLTRELQHTIHRTFDEALQRRHEYVTLEHLLYALIDEKTGSDVIQNCGGNITALRHELEQFLTQNIETLPKSRRAKPDYTAAFERVLEHAALQAQGSGQTTIDGGNILAAMFQERHSHAVYLLEKQGISRLDVLNYIAHGVSKREAGTEDDASQPVRPDAEEATAPADTQKLEDLHRPSEEAQKLEESRRQFEQRRQEAFRRLHEQQD